MATTPAVPATLQSELSTYAHKVLLTHLGALVLILALVGFGVYRGFSSYDKLLAHAEALQTQFTQAQAQYNASQKQLTDLLATDSAERAQESSQQAALVSQIAQRTAQAPSPVVSQALAPSASVLEVAEGLQAAFNLQTTPKVTQDGEIAVNPLETQTMIGLEEAGELAQANLKDETQLYTLETAKNSSLSKDLDQCVSDNTQSKQALADAQKALAVYNKALHRSRFRKILGGVGRNAERIGIAIVAFEAGRKL